MRPICCYWPPAVGCLLWWAAAPVDLPSGATSDSSDWPTFGGVDVRNAAAAVGGGGGCFAGSVAVVAAGRAGGGSGDG